MINTQIEDKFAIKGILERRLKNEVYIKYEKDSIMKIKKIVSQNRRDYVAIMVCEHCGHEQMDNGYDDENYHVNVIPQIECLSCKKKAGPDYVPRKPKYPEGFQV